MLELETTAAEQVPLIEMVFFEFSSAQPTPLVHALGAGHMVAAYIGNLGYASSAFMAIDDVSFLLGPLEILSIVGFLTCQTFMRY